MTRRFLMRRHIFLKNEKKQKGIEEERFQCLFSYTAYLPVILFLILLKNPTFGGAVKAGPRKLFTLKM